MTQTYGFEIECFGLTPSEIQTAVNSVGGRVKMAVPRGHGEYSIEGTMDRIFGYGESKQLRTRDSRSNEGSIWIAASDSSITNTANRRTSHEIISPILYRQEGLDEMKKVVKALSRAGAQVNKTCGVHVHLGLDHYSRVRRFSVAKKNRMIHRIADLYSHFQRGIDLLVPQSRRNNANSYCYRIAGNQMHYNNHEMYETSAFRFGRGVLNAGNYTTNGTIEFRQHSGSLNGSKLETWAKLLSKIVGWAINENHPNHFRTFPFPTVTSTGSNALLLAMCDYLNIEPAHKRKLLNRAVELGAVFATVEVN